MNYYIADTHFGHRNILQFDGRPFLTTDEMDAAIIENWNKVVTERDTVYHLGDFCWGKEDEWIRILRQLNGQKVLIRGNHDLKRMSGKIKPMFCDIKDYKEIKDGESTVIMCHYPILAYKRSYDRNVWMLHGHVHNNTKESAFVKQWVRELWNVKDAGGGGNWGHIVNVGCMMPHMGYTPRTLKDIQSLFYFRERGL